MLGMNSYRELSSKIVGSGCALLLCTTFWSATSAQQQSTANSDAKRSEVKTSKVQIPDIEVLDHHGRKLHLYSDLFKDRVVVVNFFFTTCTLVCPPQGRALAEVQERLGKRLGKEVFFVSISKDPKTDTVGKLKQWAKEFRVGPGWTLVTGEEGVMEKVLWDLIGDRPGPSMHYPLIFVGNDRTGGWTTASGLSNAERIVEVIDRVAESRQSVFPTHEP